MWLVRCDFTKRRNEIAPHTSKNTTSVISIPIRDAFICQGEMAKTKDEISASISALCSSLAIFSVFSLRFISSVSRIFTKKNVAITLSDPNTEEANLEENSFNPKIATNGILAYEYPAGL